eukprot:1977636-Pleurochrysis_carterae.AAC.3
MSAMSSLAQASTPALALSPATAHANLLSVTALLSRSSCTSSMRALPHSFRPSRAATAAAYLAAQLRIAAHNRTALDAA